MYLKVQEGFFVVYEYHQPIRSNPVVFQGIGVANVSDCDYSRPTLTPFSNGIPPLPLAPDFCSKGDGSVLLFGTTKRIYQYTYVEC